LEESFVNFELVSEKRDSIQNVPSQGKDISLDAFTVNTHEIGIDVASPVQVNHAETTTQKIDTTEKAIGHQVP
jgi:hypothetical protein